ncbi:MAG: hypothetical protein Kow0069_10790 [Promethearchaeota archaeon]
MFKWLVGRIGKLIGRNMNALYYSLLYRELLREVVDAKRGDVNEAFAEFKRLGELGALDSAHRQESVLRYFPGEPLKLLEYMEVLWQVIFGMPMGEHEVVTQQFPGDEYPVVKYQIKRCPVCAGHGLSEHDVVDVSKVKDSPQLYACGIMGMLQTVANFILGIRGSDHKIVFSETACIARGDPYLEITCSIVPFERDEAQRSSASTLAGSLFSIEKVEDFLNRPMDNVKKVLEDVIEKNLSMTPNELLSHFENYEEDMVRVVGYLGVHLLNEYGGLVEKLLSNATIAKAAGYWFNSLKDFVRLFLPREVTEDYHRLFVELLEGLAPEGMVERFRGFNSFEFVTLVLEGCQMALENLGVDFEGLRENIWEELRESQADQEAWWFPDVVLSLLQELLTMSLKLFSLPVKLVVASQHAQVKTVAGSMRDLYEELKDHGDRILDILGELRD